MGAFDDGFAQGTLLHETAGDVDAVGIGAMAEDGAGRALDVEVDEQDSIAAQGEASGEVDGDGGFPDSALLIGDGDGYAARHPSSLLSRTNPQVLRQVHPSRARGGGQGAPARCSAGHRRCPGGHGRVHGDPPRHINKRPKSKNGIESQGVGAGGATSGFGRIHLSSEEHAVKTWPTARGHDTLSYM